MPLAVIGLIVLLYNHNHDQNLRIQSIQETSIGQLKSAINAFGFRLAWVTRDLEYLRQLPALYQNGEAKETEFNKTIERQTKLFSDGRRGIYDHLRFIDKQGQERIRVQSINGQMTLLGDQLLQNKSDRGYVIETKRLAPGQIYISPFDLNIEHGQIELPIKPMIRFATPIYTTENEYNGAVVINYLGTDLLNRAERTFKKNYPNTWMVNANGGWIKSPDGLYDWNFMYEDRQNQNLRKTYPDVWKAINSGNSKPYQPIILSNGDLFTYATFTPQVLNNTPSQAGAEANTNKLFLISYFTAQELATATDIVSTEALFIFLLFLLISGVILYLNAHIWNKRIIAEESAKEGQEFYSTLLGATPDCILLVDSKGLIVESNQQIKDMFGYTGEAVIGHPVELLIPERFHKEHVSNRFRYMADPKRRIMGTGDTLWAKRNDSSEFPVSISLNKVETIRGTMFIAEIRDETEQYEKSQKLIEQNIELDARVKERTQALEKAIEISEQANVAKSDFLSNMSHEIRTPMNAILGLCYLLKKEDLSPAVDGMVHKIHIAGKSLLGIINDILDFSKIEANKLDIENIPFRLSDVLENLASIMASSLGSKNIETIIDAPPPGTDFLTGDGLRLGQVLINLAGNAIKFTEHGEVIVKIDKVQEDKAQKTVHLRFSVIDTGIGIEKEKLNNIFNAFSQADTSTSRTYGGTGLGLSISKQLVELMGGELEVYSVVGEGSKFTFELSFTLSEAIETAIPEMQFQRVLIADDQPTARSVLQRTMQSLGWSAD
ncbi:MAG: ATP-binding protein, partial [bacterium]